MTVLAAIRDILSSPYIYRLHQKTLGGRMIKRRIYEEFVPRDQTVRVLDVGCGPAPDRDLLGRVMWTGLELNPKYVTYVKRRLREGDEIVLGDVKTISQFRARSFDMILISGVLHHLDDATAVDMLQDLPELLASAGQIITIDPVRMPASRGLEAFLLNQDRGQYIRDTRSYDALFDAVHELNFVGHIREGLGWLPQATRVTVATKR